MTRATEDPSAPSQAGLHVALLIAALWIAEMTSAFETAMIYAAQRALTEEVGGPVRVGWLITAYLLIGAGAAALAGRLGDLYGRRRVLLILLLLAAAGSIVSAVAPDYGTLLAGRCIQGVTGAVLALCVGLIRESLPASRIAMAIGIIISGASAGTAAGLVVGGLIVDRFSWHAVFYASAALALLSWLAVLLTAAPSPCRRGTGPVDWLGGILFIPGVFAALAAITYGPAWGLRDARTWGCAGVGVALIAAWIRTARSTPNPLFDVRLLANRTVAVANGVTAIVSMTTLQIALLFSLLLQAPRWTMIGLGLSATMAGVVKLPSNVTSLLAGPLSGWLTVRVGARRTMAAGGAVTTIGWLLAMTFNDGVGQLIAVLIVISFGSTILFAVAPTVVASAVPLDRTSEAAGVLTITRQVFLGIGAQLISVVLAGDTVAAPGGAIRYPTENAFLFAMGVIVLGSAAATVLALAMPRHASETNRFT